MLHCKAIAPKYGVTPKTVRDIWNGRTWWQTTKQYWSKEEKAWRAFQMMPDTFPSPTAAGTQGGTAGLPMAHPHHPFMLPGGGVPSQQQDFAFPPGLMARGLPYLGLQGGGAYPGAGMGGMHAMQQGASAMYRPMAPTGPSNGKPSKDGDTAPTPSASGADESPPPSIPNLASGVQSSGFPSGIPVGFGQGGNGFTGYPQH